MDQPSRNIVVGVILFSALTLNTLMLLTLRPLHRCKKLSKMRYVLLIHLAISDLIQASLGYGLDIADKLLVKQLEILCTASAFFVTFCGLASICHLSLLAVDVCINVCRPLVRLEGGKGLFLLPFIGWTYALIWAGLPLFGWNEYIPESNKQCTLKWTAEKLQDKIYLLCLFVFCFILPIIIIIVSFVRIQLQLQRKLSSKMVMEQGRDSLLANQYRSAQRSGVKLCFIMISSFIIAWLPYAVVALCIVFLGYNVIPSMALQIAGLFAKTSAVLNPLVYFYNSRDARPLIVSFFRSGKKDMQRKLKDKITETERTTRREPENCDVTSQHQTSLPKSTNVSPPSSNKKCFKNISFNKDPNPRGKNQTKTSYV